MTVSIRYGILGPIESSSWFVKAVASNPNSEIVALACEKTKEKQNLINVPVFESYSELCQSPDVDAIFVPTSNTNHYEGAKLALENKKHVLIDSPFTKHKVGANELFLLAERQSCFLMEAQQTVFLSAYDRIKKMIANEEIGTICYVESRTHLPYDAACPYDAAWTRSLERGGGALNLGGAYPLTLIPFLLETEPTDWSGLGVNKVGEADTRCTLNFRCGNVLVNNVISLDFDLDDKLTIVGTNGKIVIQNYLDPDAVIVMTPNGTKRLTNQNELDAGTNVLNHVSDCISSQKTSSPVLTKKITVKTVEIISSLYSQWYGDPLN